MTTLRSILFVSPWRGIIGPNVGLAQLVAEAGGRGIEAHVACPARDGAVEAMEQQGATLHVMDEIALTPRSASPVALVGGLRRGMRSARALAELAGRVGAGVICINSENMLLAPRAGALAGVPVVVIIRGMRFGEMGLAGKAYFRLQRRWVDRYVALSDIAAEMLAGEGVDRDRISVIPNGVDTTVFAPRERDESLAAEFGIGPEDRVAVTVTHLTPRKGVHHFVEAMGRLRDRLPALKALILGDAPSEADRAYADSIGARIEQLGLEDRVILGGYRTDVPALLSLADVVVHPSETENCPRGVLEAQSAGLAVVGFDVGGMPTVVADGSTGVLVGPRDAGAMADAVERLLSDAETLADMGQAGRRRVMERFDLQTNLARLMDLLVEESAMAQ